MSVLLRSPDAVPCLRTLADAVGSLTVSSLSAEGSRRSAQPLQNALVSGFTKEHRAQMTVSRVPQPPQYRQWLSLLRWQLKQFTTERQEQLRAEAWPGSPERRFAERSLQFSEW